MNRLDIKLKDHKHPSDATVVMKDGKEFQVHRSVLSQASSFFEKLLNSDMKENNEGVIRLEMILESQMADILEFIYTGRVQISTQENAESLLELADYLVLPNLKALAGKCLEEYITTSNCISIYYLAERFLCQGLIAGCRKVIHAHFASVAKSDDFLNLSSQEVEKWICSDDIVIDAEENVFEFLLRWIDHDKSQRGVKFRDLFRHVRLTCISRDFLANNVVTNDLVKEDEACLESVFLALQWFDRSPDCDVPRPHPPRKALERDVIVVTVCASESLNFHTNFYLPSTEQWYRLPSTSCEPTRVFSYQGKVFVVTEHFARSQCYDPDLKRWSPAPWTKLDSKHTIMKLANTSFQIRDVLVIKHEIFFLVEETKQSFSPALWRYIPDLNSMSSWHAWVWKKSFCSVVVDRLIYAIGGVVAACCSDCFTFDTDGKSWKQRACLNEARRDACGVSKNDEKIFVAGGVDTFGNFMDSCEVYNLATNEWQLIASLTMPRYRGKMVVIDETIYVLGGQFKERYKQCKDACVFLDGMVPVECYDEERDRWNDRTRMPIDKIFFNENPKSTDLLSLNVCSVRLLNTFSSKSTGLVPIMAGLSLNPRTRNRRFVYVKNDSSCMECLF